MTNLLLTICGMKLIMFWLMGVKISSKYMLSTGDKIIILDIENINNLIYKIKIIDYSYFRRKVC